ncbi:hypothetical protein P9B97_02215 [Bacillus paralicheniformis]|uniref:hypothetical protein n=1 Tax=Bacillus paralicheniformis TaxID=1648923 RepID=UPI002DBAF2DF|nr:hypothetical protein [Bacillus paralicheniformis]MEC1050899.1 hypothetical protein [Bacillus paralicheniformis]MEC1087726.1 hypothetical protein [Bacillus paralicheniformis]MEC1108795.1 hypothetical protein [Bacillus paralicheniformis]MEC1137150.1 hypothetical protein [Bacillus paralicheniformis]MEC1148440.1 hypothetical protein [Bacillus paralicheniformis]
MAKIDVERITLERLEGPSQECIKKSHNTWKQAEATISEWALTSPKNGGYNKVDFHIVWKDGSEYSGRFALQYKHVSNSKGLSQEIISSLQYCINHDSSLAQQAKKMLDHLQIG